MSIFSTIENVYATFIKYGSVVITVVKAVEQSNPGADGATKKQIVLAAVLAAIHAGETVPIATVQAISFVIDTIVSSLNALGIFGKSTPVTSVSVAPAPTS